MPLPASGERIALSIAAFSSGYSDLVSGIKLGPLRPVAIAEVEHQWLSEAKERLRGIKAGERTTIDAFEVLAEGRRRNPDYWRYRPDR
jgi:hypothetical protein